MFVVTIYRLYKWGYFHEIRTCADDGDDFHYDLIKGEVVKSEKTKVKKDKSKKTKDKSEKIKVKSVKTKVQGKSHCMSRKGRKD